MADPLSEVIGLLRPAAVVANPISAAGRWGVRFTPFGHPGFCIMTEGRCRLAVDGQQPLMLEAGDFVLLPGTPAFTMTGLDPVTPVPMDPNALARVRGEIRYGQRGGTPDMRQLGGHFVFDSPDAALLVSLLPTVIHIRGLERLTALVQLVGDEARQQRSGRELVLARLAEVLLIEALRAVPGDGGPPGLLRGLADARIAAALRQMHATPSRPWTIAALAEKVALSRSAFFDRFTRTVGLAPMEYLLQWRMALAKRLLSLGQLRMEQIAERVGYGSASAFSTAFSRHVGRAPSGYAKALRS